MKGMQRLTKLRRRLPGERWCDEGPSPLKETQRPTKLRRRSPGERRCDEGPSPLKETQRPTELRCACCRCVCADPLGWVGVSQRMDP